MAKTSIEWTSKVWNPVRGCSKVSSGCKNCFAERMAARFCGEGQPYHGLIRDGKWSNEARFIPEMLDAPLKLKKPSIIFVNSMSDLFHKDISDEQIAEVFGVIAVAAKSFFGPRIKGRPARDFGPHVFQILTKRAERLTLLSTNRFREMVARAAYRHAMDRVDAGWLNQCISGRREYGNHCTLDPMWPLPNLHLGVSVENQAAADDRIPHLLRCPAAVRWVSAEPLLGYLDLSKYLFVGEEGDWEYCGSPREMIDWVVTGTESGPGRRPANIRWIESIVEQCKNANVPVFVKQIEVEDLHGKTRVSKDPTECGGWPKHLNHRMTPGDKWP